MICNDSDDNTNDSILIDEEERSNRRRSLLYVFHNAVENNCFISKFHHLMESFQNIYLNSSNIIIWNQASIYQLIRFKLLLFNLLHISLVLSTVPNCNQLCLGFDDTTRQSV